MPDSKLNSPGGGGAPSSLTGGLWCQITSLASGTGLAKNRIPTTVWLSGWKEKMRNTLNLTK